MKRYLAYLKSVLRHKKFVYEECLKLGVPRIIAILHDWDKFRLGTFRSYANSFYDPVGANRYNPDGSFDAAWNSHQKINKHHWQYYVLIMDKGDIKPLPMPELYAREMLADWRGAGRAYGNPDTKGWYLERRDTVFAKYIHPDTLKWLDEQLGV